MYILDGSTRTQKYSNESLASNTALRGVYKHCKKCINDWQEDSGQAMPKYLSIPVPT